MYGGTARRVPRYDRALAGRDDTVPRQAIERKRTVDAGFRSEAETRPLDLVALSRHLETVGLRLDQEVPVRQFSSGLANINYLIGVSGHPVVLRRPPDGDLPPGAHDMAREHRILSRLPGAFPLAPQSRHLCEDRAVLGVPFQLLEYRPGVVIKGDDRSRLEARPELARAIGEMLVGVLVSIHEVDAAAIGLGDLGRPESFVTRAIAGWRRRAERLDPAPETATLIAEIADWLEAQPCGERQARLLHCDFKLDNLILDSDTLSASAVVDWDMGTRGDPLFDLATMVSYWTDAQDPPCMHRLAQMPSTAPGFPSRSEAVERYARASGVDLSDFPLFRVLAMFKLAVVFLQLHRIRPPRSSGEGSREHFGTLGEELLLFTRDIAQARAPLL